jgi:hypothetical protein
MKKLFMILCIVIMFFGIVGCPDDSEDPPPRAFTSNAVNSPQVGVGDNTPGGDGASAIPEPATLFLLGSGLVGLAVLGRNKFKK